MDPIRRIKAVRDDLHKLGEVQSESATDTEHKIGSEF